MFPFFIPIDDEDVPFLSVLGVIGLFIYLIYSAFIFAQHQIFNVKLNHQNTSVEELAHQKWHDEYTLEEITVSDEDYNSYPKLPVCYDVNLVVWSKKVQGVQENGGYAFTRAKLSPKGLGFGGHPPDVVFFTFLKILKIIDWSLN